jgi:hypothetical protein
MQLNAACVGAELASNDLETSFNRRLCRASFVAG